MISLITALMLTAPMNTVHDFSTADRGNFYTIHDTVMGGVSAGKLTFTGDGSMVFSGNLSLIYSLTPIT